MKLDAVLEKFKSLLPEKLTAPASLSITSIPRPAEALLVRALAQSCGKPVVWVADGPQSLDAIYQDLSTLTQGTDDPIIYFPAWDAFPSSPLQDGRDRARPSSPKKGTIPSSVDTEITGYRLAALLRLMSKTHGKSETNGAKLRPFACRRHALDCGGLTPLLINRESAVKPALQSATRCRKTKEYA
jgi:hypothetical protein